jgi:beta-lactamase class A
MRRIMALLLAAGCTPSTYESMPGFEREVRLAHLRHAPESKMALWLGRTDGTEILAIDADHPIPGASTVKILILIEAYAQSLDHRLDLAAETTYLAEDRVPGSGSLQYQKPGSTWSWRHLLCKMIVESDNVASNMLLRRLGMKNVNARAEAMGLKVTRFSREFMDEEARRKGIENWTTAREMAAMVRAIVRRDILTPDACEEMIEILEMTSRGRIAAGVPKFVPVGHKGGSLPGLRHDVGWVRLPGHPYVLSIFLDNVLEKPGAEEDRGYSAIESVARAVYEKLGPTDE